MRDQPVEDLDFIKPELEHGVRVVLQSVPHVPAPGNSLLLPPQRYLRYLNMQLQVPHYHRYPTISGTSIKQVPQ